MTSTTVDSNFLEFLETSKRIYDNADTTIQRNESTLSIDLHDLSEYSESLFIDIIRNFSSKYEVLNSTVELYSIKYFGKKLSNVSFFNDEGVYKIRDLKSVKLGELITFSGTVTRTTQVRPELIKGTFACKECNSMVYGVEQEFKYTEPVICPNHLCTNRKLWKLELDESNFLIGSVYMYKKTLMKFHLDLCREVSML